MLKQFIHYNVAFQFIYTFMSFVNLKVLYKEKAQITDIFLFAAASIILIVLSIFTFMTSKFTYDNYFISLILNRILLFLLGYALSLIGLIYIITYLNILSIGYNFSYYVNFISRRIECYFSIIGFIILNLSIYIKGDKKYGLYL